MSTRLLLFLSAKHNNIVHLLHFIYKMHFYIWPRALYGIYHIPVCSLDDYYYAKYSTVAISEFFFISKCLLSQKLHVLWCELVKQNHHINTLYAFYFYWKQWVIRLNFKISPHLHKFFKWQFKRLVLSCSLSETSA